MKPRIRRARLADARGIARVHAHSWRHAYATLLPASYLNGLVPPKLALLWRARLRRSHRELQVWVATLEETVVGFCVSHGCRQRTPLGRWSGEVSYLYVHPALTGRGVGGRLFDRALAELERRGFRWAVVGVLEANAGARRFYERHGLRFEGIRWHDRRFGAAVVRYGKPLNPVVDFAALRCAAVRSVTRPA